MTKETLLKDLSETLADGEYDYQITGCTNLDQHVSIRGRAAPVKTRGQEIAETLVAPVPAENVIRIGDGMSFGAHVQLDGNYRNGVDGVANNYRKCLAKAIDAAIAETKEATAKVCDAEAGTWCVGDSGRAFRVGAEKCALAIRQMK